MGRSCSQNGGRPRRTWQDNIKMAHKAINVNKENWLDSARDKDYWRAVVNVVLDLPFPYSIELVRIIIARHNLAVQ